MTGRRFGRLLRRRRTGFNGRRELKSGERRETSLKESFEGVPKVLQDMKAIGHGLGPKGSLWHSVGFGRTATQHVDCRMGFEPLGHGRDGTIGQIKDDDLSPFQIYDHRDVAMSLP